MHSEELGDGGTGDVRVQHGGAVAAALHLAGEQAGDHALAYAALAADNGNDAADGSALVQGLEKALLAALAVFAAGGAVVIAIFAHYFYLFCKQ